MYASVFVNMLLDVLLELVNHVSLSNGHTALLDQIFLLASFLDQSNMLDSYMTKPIKVSVDVLQVSNMELHVNKTEIQSRTLGVV
jgi:hypothetical protein